MTEFAFSLQVNLFFCKLKWIFNFKIYKKIWPSWATVVHWILTKLAVFRGISIFWDELQPGGENTAFPYLPLDFKELGPNQFYTDATFKKWIFIFISEFYFFVHCNFCTLLWHSGDRQLWNVIFSTQREEKESNLGKESHYGSHMSCTLTWL